MTDSDGYVKLDNGLILQWGKISNVIFDESHFEIAQFKQSFPHVCFSVVASCNQSTIIKGMRTVYVSSYNNSQAFFLPGFTVEQMNGSITWMAVGY